MQVELEIFERSKTSKCDSKQLRRAGYIPAIIYSKGQPGKGLSLKKEAIDELLRKTEKGFLSTTVCVLKDASGKTVRALIKDIQYHVTTYAVLHIDFIELQQDSRVEVKVPIECLSAVDCIGVKGGGYLRQVMRHLPVRCLPDRIPHSLKVDVKDLDLRQAKRVADLVLPEGVVTLVKPQDVVVSIVK